MADQYNKHQLYFIKHWYSADVNYIEEFITAAHNEPHINWQRKSKGDGTEADYKLIASEAASLRQACARYIFGSGSAAQDKRNDPDADFPFDERFRVWEQRAKDDAPKWHIRFLPRKDFYVAPVSQTGSAAFDDLFSNDATTNWK